MYMYVYTHTYTYIYVYIYIYIHTYINYTIKNLSEDCVTVSQASSSTGPEGGGMASEDRYPVYMYTYVYIYVCIYIYIHTYTHYHITKL